MNKIYTFLLLAATLRADIFFVQTDPSPKLQISDIALPGGFSYTITNGESALWLELISISNTTTLFGSFSYLSSFPVLAPSGTITETYSPGISGLVEYLFDPSASSGAKDSGEFLFLANFYSSDPTAGPVAPRSTSQVSVGYEVEYIDQTVIPEPGMMVVGGLATLCVIGYCRRKKS